MRINLNYFDEKGRWRLGSFGAPRMAKWHPLFAEGEEYQFIAVAFGNGGIHLYYVEENSSSKVKLLLVQMFIESDASCSCLDWSPDGRYLVGGYKDNRLRLYDVTTNKRVSSFDGRGYLSREGARFTGIKDVCFSPDSKFVASLAMCDGQNSSPLRLFSFPNGELHESFEVEGVDWGQCVKITFCSDSNNLYLAQNKSIIQYEAESTKVHSLFQYPGLDIIKTLTFSPDGRTLASGWHGGVRLHDSKTGEVLWHYTPGGRSSFLGGEETASSLSFSPDGKQLIASVGERSLQSPGAEKILFVLDVTTGKVVESFKDNSERNVEIAFCPDGNLVASVSLDEGIVRILNLRGKFCGESSPGRTPIAMTGVVVFGPDGRWITDGDSAGWIRSWDLRNGIKTKAKMHSRDGIRSLASTPDGRFLISGSSDMAVILWDRYSGELLSQGLQEGSMTSLFVATSPDGRFAACCNDESRIGLWEIDYAMLKVKTILKSDFSKQNSVAFHPNGQMITGWGREPAAGVGLCVWDCYTKELVRSFRYNDAWSISNVTVCPDGRIIIAVAEDVDECYMLRIIDINSGKVIDSCVVDRFVKSIDISPTGRYIVVGSSNETAVQLWNLENSKRVDLFTGNGHRSRIESTRFSPDGRYIISASLDPVPIIWSLEHIIGPEWLEEHMNTPLILTAVWFPGESLKYMEETDQGIIVRDKPLSRCGECGKVFPVEEEWLGKELRCPVEVNGRKCNRLLKLNEFVAGLPGR